MLKDRIITGVTLLVLILACLFLLEPAVFVYCILAVFALAAWEWARLSSFSQPWVRVVYGLSVALVAWCVIRLVNIDGNTLANERLRDVLGIGALWWSFALLWVITYPGSSIYWKNAIVRLLMGYFAIVPAVLALVTLVMAEHGRWLFIYVAGIVVTADVGAYCAGKLFGKHKLAPQVSPGKSWEGFAGGIASSMLFAWLVSLYSPLFGLGVVALVLVTGIAALFSVLGDLVESMLKRHEGIKDSSRLLPGHGGIMDRVDSICAAAPVFLLLVMLLSMSSGQVA